MDNYDALINYMGPYAGLLIGRQLAADKEKGNLEMEKQRQEMLLKKMAEDRAQQMFPLLMQEKQAVTAHTQAQTTDIPQARATANTNAAANTLNAQTNAGELDLKKLENIQKRVYDAAYIGGADYVSAVTGLPKEHPMIQGIQGMTPDQIWERSSKSREIKQNRDARLAEITYQQNEMTKRAQIVANSRLTMAREKINSPLKMTMEQAAVSYNEALQNAKAVMFDPDATPEARKEAMQLANKLSEKLRGLQVLSNAKTDQDMAKARAQFPELGNITFPPFQPRTDIGNALLEPGVQSPMPQKPTHRFDPNTGQLVPVK